MKPIHLRCEHLDKPLGLDVDTPRFSWAYPVIEDSSQSAYRILVSETMDDLAPDRARTWDSGRVESSNSILITYAGIALNPAVRYYWTVLVWDSEGRCHSAEPTWFETGMFGESAFRARWIAGGSLIRKQISIPRAVDWARVWICALGYGELWINGCKISDAVLDPAQTDYQKRVFYVTHDVTRALQPGNNVIAVFIGEGFFGQSEVRSRYAWADEPYGEPRVLLRLEARNRDERVIELVSDETWEVLPSPILRNNVYGGETYDGRIGNSEQLLSEGSGPAGNSIRIVDSPGGLLTAQPLPSIRVTASMEPVHIKPVASGLQIFDFGQNIAGWVRLHTEAGAGTEIQLRYAEELQDNGAIDTASTGVFATGLEQIDRYIAGGRVGGETWRPRFTYHGFRYVEVSSDAPVSLVAEQVRSDLAEVGRFHCSDERINRLYQTARWTVEGNTHGLLTDCPARERCGWLGDAHIVAEFTMLNYDSAAFWTKVVDDIFTSFTPDGPTMIAPGKRTCGLASPAWGAACVLIPWYVYLYYDDLAPCDRHFDDMVRWIDILESKAKGHIISEGLGDWCPPGSTRPKLTPVALTSTAYFIHCLDLMAKIDRLVRDGGRAEWFTSRAASVRAAFNRAFFDQERMSYGSQTGDAMAIAFGVVPTGLESHVAASLASDVMHRGHHTAGIYGMRYLFDVLGANGHDDAIMRIIHREEYPGFGYLFQQGATTFWETWERDPIDCHTPRSRNHPMHAGFCAWLHQGLAGIRPDWESPGFARFVIRPQFLKGITFAEASYDSIRGSIKVRWERLGDSIRIDLEIPGNSAAVVRLGSTFADRQVSGGRHRFIVSADSR